MGADLLAILNQSANGLAAFRAMTQTASHNIANVNTVGYSRQRVELEAMPADFLRTGSYVGQGVDITAITQARDAFLERQVPGALAGEAQHNATSDTLAAVSVLNPEIPGGVPDALTNFYASMRRMAQNPGDLALRTQVLTAARDVATSFNRTAGALEDARSGVDVHLSSDVDKVNDLSSQIASLNGQISAARTKGAEPNDLLDARRKATDELSKLTGAVAVPDSDGNVNMTLAGGTALVVGLRAAKLSVTPDSTNGGHLKLQITRVGATAADSMTPVSAFGGEIRGLVDARDGTLKNALDSLDTIAFDFANTLNAQHRSGFDLNGNAGGAMFTVGATSPGAAASITLDATLAADPRRLAAASSATTVPGDGANALALVGTERTALSGGQDVATSFSSMVAAFGTDARSAKALADHDASVAGYLSDMRQSVSGVSIDEEMVSLTQAQRAFEAMSKVMTTADDMLDTLMQLR
jgi:flagellar hook-associated protein 1 FlgK